MLDTWMMEVEGRVQGVVCLARLGQVLVGAQPSLNDVVLDSPHVSPLHARLEVCYCGKRGRIVRYAAANSL